MIQQQARKNLQERVQRWDPDNFSGQGQAGVGVVHRNNKKVNKVAPLQLVPTTLEEAPLRRMDRRALNALRKRRADRHMIAFLIVVAILVILIGGGAIAIWVTFRNEMR